MHAHPCIPRAFPGHVEYEYLLAALHHKAVFAAQDSTACKIYLAMQAPGSLTLLLAAAVVPNLWSPAVEACSTYAATTAVITFLHLALLMVQPAAYRKHREVIIICLRILYMASSVFGGLQECSTVTKWWSDSTSFESPFSAFLWRAGLVAMTWHAVAMRLPIKQHLYVQNATAIAYMLLLAEGVCQALPQIQHGQYLVSVGLAALKVVWEVWEMMSYTIIGGAVFWDVCTPNVLAPSIKSVVIDEPQLACEDRPACTACLLVVRCWQVLAASLLLGAALYYLEAADRAKWYKKRMLCYPRQQQQ